MALTCAVIACSPVFLPALLACLPPTVLQMMQRVCLGAGMASQDLHSEAQVLITQAMALTYKSVLMLLEHAAGAIPPPVLDQHGVLQIRVRAHMCSAVCWLVSVNHPVCVGACVQGGCCGVIAGGERLMQ